MRLIYLAHPYGGLSTNADLAEAWCAELSSHFDAVFFAPWVHLARHWAYNSENIARALFIDCEAVKRSDEVWFVVMGKLSPGQLKEEETAKSAGVRCRYFDVELLQEMTEDEPTELVRVARETLRLELAE